MPLAAAFCADEFTIAELRRTYAGLLHPAMLRRSEA
jgi:hypothetical protein